MKVFTKIALASTGMVEIKRNQAGFILYIQGRANPPRLERFVTFWSFPRWSNILQPLTGGRRNRLTICQIRYKKQIVRRWHCLHTISYYEPREQLSLQQISCFPFPHYCSTLGLFNWWAMDILREYLESSIIHGLTYISTAKVQV